MSFEVYVQTPKYAHAHLYVNTPPAITPLCSLVTSPSPCLLTGEGLVARLTFVVRPAACAHHQTLKLIQQHYCREHNDSNITTMDTELETCRTKKQYII